MRRLLFILPILALPCLSCQPPKVATLPDTAEPDQETGEDSREPDSSDTEQESGVVDTDSGLVDTNPEIVPGVTWPLPCAEIYDPDELQSFSLDIDPSEWSALRSDCRAGFQTYHPASFTWREESVDAMVRLKGNWSWSCEKMQFIISFNEVDPDARFHGLRKLVLDAPWYDPSLLHERLAFFALERHGAPASCVNHARLDVNGTYYGVFANVERLDHEYLERNFEDPSGNLYQAAWELKTNEEEADTSDRDAFWAATDIDALDAVVDLDAAVLAWAGEAMLPDPDSYWAGVEINFYLYGHPERGLVFLPYDADISFGENIWPGLENADPILYQHTGWLREEQYRVALSDPAWCEAFVAQMAHAREAYDVPLLQSRIEAWADQIATAVDEDPNKTWSADEHRQSVSDLHSFVERRANFVDAWLAEGGHCPPDWDP